MNASGMNYAVYYSDAFDKFVCPMHTYSPVDMQNEIEKVGLVWEEASIWRNTETFEDADGYKAYVSGWLPHLYHLSGKDRDDFLDEVVKTHCARPDRNKNGEITVWVSLTLTYFRFGVTQFIGSFSEPNLFGSVEGDTLPSLGEWRNLAMHRAE